MSKQVCEYPPGYKVNHCYRCGVAGDVRKVRWCTAPVVIPHWLKNRSIP